MKKILTLLTSATLIGACSSPLNKINIIKNGEEVVKYENLDSNSAKIAIEFAQLETKECAAIYKLSKEHCELKITELYSDLLSEVAIDGSIEEKMKWLKDQLIVQKVELDDKLATPLLFESQRLIITYSLQLDESQMERQTSKILRMVFDPQIDAGDPSAIRVMDDYKKEHMASNKE